MKTKQFLLSLSLAMLAGSLNSQNASEYNNNAPILGTNSSGFGFNALRNNAVAGTNNSAFGWHAMFLNNTGSDNCAIGNEALFNNNLGNYNTALGHVSLFSNLIGNANVALGDSALFSNTNSDNTALGTSSMKNNTAGTANTAVGNRSLFKNTTGSENTSVGHNSLYDNTTGNYNTAIGWSTLLSNTTGNHNSAFGRRSLRLNTTGTNNSSFGSNTLYQNSTGSYNTVFGGSVMGLNTTGSWNTALGWGALAGNTTVDNNTAVGALALSFNSSGANNTGVGHSALITNTTGRNNSALGYFADVAAGNYTNATAIGSGAVVQGSNLVQLGDANVTQIECWSGTYATTSDGRFKKNISENDVKGLEFITQLRPVVYNMDTRKLTEFMTKNLPDSIRRLHLAKDFRESSAIRQSGFIAQEVEEAAKKSNYNFNGLNVPKDKEGHYSVSYAQFVVPLVKAVQQQQQMIEELKEQIRQITANAQNGATKSGLTAINHFELQQNEPNPFAFETTIKYALPQDVKKALLVIYDLSGKQIKSIELAAQGGDSVIVTSDNLAAGIYIYSIVADNKVLDTKRMFISEK